MELKKCRLCANRGAKDLQTLRFTIFLCIEEGCKWMRKYSFGFSCNTNACILRYCICFSEQADILV